MNIVKRLSVPITVTFDTEPYMRHEMEIRIRTVDPHSGDRGEWSEAVLFYEEDGKVVQK
jgi:hypothetical protein